MHMTLAQIRTFERIARLGSFHAAARQLGLTQPSVSQYAISDGTRARSRWLS